MKKRYVVGLSIIILACGWMAVWFGLRMRAQAWHVKAVASLQIEDPLQARVFSENALKIQPNRSQFLLTYAEAVFKDETLDSGQRMRLALDSLGKIDDHAIESYEARIHEASIFFFNQLMPKQAEAALNRAVRIAPHRTSALHSLFQIYCCTARDTFVEPLFIELAANTEQPKDKVAVLSNWFLSQFDLRTYNQRTDNRLGVGGMLGGNIPVSQQRLLGFRDAEPDSISARLALAYWFLLRTDGKQAKKLLDELDPEDINPADPLFLVTAVNTYLEVGEIDLAKDLHSYWDDKNYYEYWRQKGVIEQDYEQDLKAAVVSLEKALTIWPGQIDPSIYFRLETCFQKMGRAEDALRVREKASQLRQVVEVGRIKELREIVLTENFSEANYRKFSEFYDALGRSLEKEAWGNLALSAD